MRDLASGVTIFVSILMCIQQHLARGEMRDITLHAEEYTPEERGTWTAELILKTEQTQPRPKDMSFTLPEIKATGVGQTSWPHGRCFSLDSTRKLMTFDEVVVRINQSKTGGGPCMEMFQLALFLGPSNNEVSRIYSELSIDVPVGTRFIQAGYKVWDATRATTVCYRRSLCYTQAMYGGAGRKTGVKSSRSSGYQFMQLLHSSYVECDKEAHWRYCSWNRGVRYNSVNGRRDIRYGSCSRRQ